MTATSSTDRGDLDCAREVLVFARESQTAANRAQADLLTAAATWITPGGDTGLTLAGPGAPLVAEFCIAEFALAISRSTDGGRALVAAAVELKYRLPRVWARVQADDLEAWRARRVAEETFGLSFEAAAFVDAQIAPFAHRIGIAALERLIAEAIGRFMPDKAAEDAEKAADSRHFSIDHQQVSFGGTSQVTAELDLADALDLDTAVAKGAHELLTLGSTDSLDVRRSIAAGQIARNQLALDLTEGDKEPATTARRQPKPRQLVLHVHLSDTAITGTGNSGSLELARVENQRRILTADQIRTWCANPDTEMIVKPVIDLNEHIHVEGHEVPARLREQVILRDHACVFPWCTRSARKTDADQTIPHADGGTTSSDNIAPLCRRHHRLKTHSAWTYTMLEPGSFLWSSPHGYQLLRDHHGTLDVSRDPETRLLRAPHRYRSRLITRSARCATIRGYGVRSRMIARCSTTCSCAPECESSAAGCGPLVDRAANQEAHQSYQGCRDHHLEEQNHPPGLDVHPFSEETADHGAHEAEGEGEDPADCLAARDDQSAQGADDDAGEDGREDASGAHGSVPSVGCASRCASRSE